MRARSSRTSRSLSASGAWCGFGSTRKVSATCRASSTCSRRTASRSRKAVARPSTSRSSTATTRSRPAACPTSRSAMATRRAASLLLCLAFVPLAAAAQTYPTRPVRLMVPFPPGGATDIVGRLVGAKMQEVWGQPVVIENKPGAGTVVGTEYVAKSAPDGYTLGFVVTAYVINQRLRSDLPSDPLKDLIDVTQVQVYTL